MIPATVTFAGGPINPMVFYRRLRAPIPVSWTRHQFVMEANMNPERVTAEWLNENCHGRYTLNSTEIRAGYVVVIGFEQDNDAVMFRLMDGEIAVKEKLQVIF